MYTPSQRIFAFSPRKIHKLQYLTLILLLAFHIGCNRTSPTSETNDISHTKSDNGQTTVTIALLGDESRIKIAQQLSADPSIKVIAPGEDANAVDFATAANSSDFVLLVMDSTKGPRSSYFCEHSIILRQTETHDIGIMLSNTEQMEKMHNEDLLSLEEDELRKTLQSYNLPGNSIPCFFDAKLLHFYGGPELIWGIPATITWLKALKPRKRYSRDSTKTTTISAIIYMMLKVESTFSRPIQSGDLVHIYLGGHLQNGVLNASSQISPGSAENVHIHFKEPLDCAIGSRFFIVMDGHAVGAGTVSNLDLPHQ